MSGHAGDALRAWLDAKGESQRAFAMRIDMTAQWLGSVIGTGRASPELARKIEAATGGVVDASAWVDSRRKRTPVTPVFSGAYVAGASAEIARAERVIRLLTESGVAVTFDWCKHMRRVADSGGPLTREVAEQSADADLDGVKRASVVLLLEPGWAVPRFLGDRYEPVRVTTTGAWSELGAALALDIPVVVARPSTTNAAKSGTPETFVHNIFLARAALVCADDDAAIRAVVRMAIVGSLPVVDAPASEAAQ